MERKPPWILWALPFVLAGAIGCFGWYGYERGVALTGISGSRLRQYRAEELLRWIGSAGAAWILSTAVVAAVWWPARRSWIRAGKCFAIAFLLLYSCAPAYWPEHEWVADGWIVHPPKIAIHGPALSGLLAWAIAAAVRARSADHGQRPDRPSHDA